jgi:hypothetical protein
MVGDHLADWEGCCMDGDAIDHGFGSTPLGIRARERNIAEILSRRYTLRTPLFQRPFTWTTLEVYQLLEDLWGAYQRNAYYYFIGQIVFIIEGKWLDIADGQQRMATMTMILAYARDRLAAERPDLAARLQALIVDPSGRGRLQLSEADSDFFAQWVQTPGRMAELSIKTDQFGSDAQFLLHEAAAEIARFFDASPTATVEAFIFYFTRCASFTVIDCDQLGDAVSIYVAMNNRGKTLDESDLLKGVFLMGEELSADDRMQCARAWEAEEQKSGRENFSRLLAYIPRLVGSQRLISPGEIAALRDIVATHIGVKAFMLDFLPRCAKAHRDLCHAIVDAGADSADVNRRVRCLHLHAGPTWEPLAIAYLIRRGGRSPNLRAFFLLYERFVSAAFLRSLQPHERLKGMERAWTLIDDEMRLLGPDGPFEFSQKVRSALRTKVGGAVKEENRRYLVLRISAALNDPVGVYESANVEHILPKTGNVPWRKIFAQNYGAFANMVGNYTLLTEAQNELAGNKPFAEKLKIYRDERFPMRALTASVITLSDWTPEQLYKRHDDLCLAMSREWELARRLVTIMPTED